MRFWQTAIILGTFSLAGWVQAADVVVVIPGNETPQVTPAPAKPAPAKPAPAPPPAPNPVKSTPEIDALIRQLGDADFRQREAAVAKLRGIGPSALDALKRARDTSPDPEVVSRAISAIHYIERPPMPGRLPASRQSGFLGRGRGNNANLKMSVENGARRVEVREPGRVIRIIEGNNGIEMSVTGIEDGKEVTRNFNARSAEELKKQNPEAFELHQRWTGRLAGAVNGGRVRGLAQQDPFVIGGADGGMGIGVVQDPLAVRDAEVRGLIEQMRRNRVILRDGNDPVQVLERMQRDRAVAERQAAARQQIDAIKRNVEAELEGRRATEPAGPPADVPVRSVLGVKVAEDPAGKGLVVTGVVGDTRAARIGLQPADTILSINEKAIGQRTDIRRVLLESKDPLVVEVERDGKTVKLTEKAEPAKP